MNLRAGLIGLGRMGRLHARVLQSLGGVTLAAVLDPAGDRYHAATGIPHVPDIEAFVHAGLDYAVLACPTLLHAELGSALAAAGIPTLIEKPLAEDPDAAHALAAAFRATGTTAAVGYTERFNPAVRELRARLGDGQLGDVFSVTTRRTGPYPIRVAEVGVIHDLATHDLDLTAWITGSCYTSITARTAHRSGRPHEDLLLAIGQLADGTITDHQVNWVSPLKDRATIVTGERGILVADTLNADITYWVNGEVRTHWDALSAFRGVSEGDVIRYGITKKEPLAAEHEAFRDLVLGHEAAIATLDDGLRAVLAANTAVHSATSGAKAVVPTLAARTARAGLTPAIKLHGRAEPTWTERPTEKLILLQNPG